MSSGGIEQIADAILYEGYILYPYRPSALKNRQRWNFGAISPRIYAGEQGGSERWRVQTECLLRGDERTRVKVTLRFLHLIERRVARVRGNGEHTNECSEADLEFVETLNVNGKQIQQWQEAAKCEFELPTISLEKSSQHKKFEIAFPPKHETEMLRDGENCICGALIREQRALCGKARIVISPIRDSLCRVALEIDNATAPCISELATRDQAMLHSFVSLHAILQATDGEFVSLLEPPPEFADAASQCKQDGLFPVLAGGPGQRAAMLASPVILYDYPTIAPESAGDLFDGTEIDEILSLRILSLTEEEKTEMRQCDERARRILERLEADPQRIARLHGAIRSKNPLQTAAERTQEQRA